MSEIKAIIEKIRNFNHERDWEQFHTLKDLAIALNIETSELLELFLWKRDQSVDIGAIKQELADILIFALTIADKLDLDISDIVHEKLKLNSIKYPIASSKGSDKKQDTNDSLPSNERKFQQ